MHKRSTVFLFMVVLPLIAGCPRFAPRSWVLTWAAIPFGSVPV